MLGKLVQGKPHSLVIIFKLRIMGKANKRISLPLSHLPARRLSEGPSCEAERDRLLSGAPSCVLSLRARSQACARAQARLLPALKDNMAAPCLAASLGILALVAAPALLTEKRRGGHEPRNAEHGAQLQGRAQVCWLA